MGDAEHSLCDRSERSMEVGIQEAGKVRQILEGRYIDRKKLMKLLSITFGEGDYEVRVSGNTTHDTRGLVC